MSRNIMNGKGVGPSRRERRKMKNGKAKVSAVIFKGGSVPVNDSTTMADLIPQIKDEWLNEGHKNCLIAENYEEAQLYLDEMTKRGIEVL